MVRAKAKKSDPTITLGGADESKAIMPEETHGEESADTGVSKEFTADLEAILSALPQEMTASADSSDEDGPLPDVSSIVAPEVLRAAAVLRPEEVTAGRVKTSVVEDTLKPRYPNSPEAASATPEAYRQYFETRGGPPKTVQEEMDSLAGVIRGEPEAPVGPSNAEMVRVLLQQNQMMQDQMAAMQAQIAALSKPQRRRRSSVEEPGPEVYQKMFDDAARVQRSDLIARAAVVAVERDAKAPNAPAALAELADAERRKHMASTRARDIREVVNASLAAKPTRTDEEYAIEQAVLDAQKSRKFKDENIRDLERQRTELGESIAKFKTDLNRYEPGHPAREGLEKTITALLIQANGIDERIAAVRRNKTKAIAMAVMEAENKRRIEEAQARQLEHDKREKHFDETFQEWLREDIAGQQDMRLSKEERTRQLNETVRLILSSPTNSAPFKERYRDYLRREARALNELARRHKAGPHQEVRKAEGPMQLAAVAQRFSLFPSGPPRDRSDDYGGGRF